MTTTSTLSRLVDEWPGWGSLFDEGRFAVPEVLRVLDVNRIRVEEEHEDGAIVVRAELPGMDPDKDIDVTVTEGMLEITAHREQREETEEKGRVRSEFHYGSFLRRLSLPPGASDDVSATYHDGILEVRVPVADVTGPQRRAIPVSRT